jgi:NAD(P)-dependent dehydrogenase (short-subunit alcohol dehydrogenase family)
MLENVQEVKMSKSELEGRWALILGASSGFGAATSRALAKVGMNILGVHLDPRSRLPKAKEVITDIEATGSKAVFFNTNAAAERKRTRVLDKIEEILADDPANGIHFMLHSLAFGSLLPFIAEDPEEAISESQMVMTLRVMAHTLVYWVQDLVQRDLLSQGSRVYALSSGGAEHMAPNYGAVSAAKAALESHMRQLTLELGSRGIAVNCLRPGVTDTPALRAIPGHEAYVEEALRRNPHRRLTTPDDVATTLVALADPALTWLSGAVIPVDGGESIVG